MSTTITCPHCGQKFDEIHFPVDMPGACPACGRQVNEHGVQNRFTGAQASDRFQFSTRKMFGVVTVVCVLLGLIVVLILPMIQYADRRAHRNGCINNLKKLGLAMYNHHDVMNRLPLASSQPRTGRPGVGTGANPAGYSWIAGLLPYMEEVILYDELNKADPLLQHSPFDPAGKPELGCSLIYLLKCPNDTGRRYVDTSQSEYQTYQTQHGKFAPARSTYVAFAASHFANDTGLADPFDSGRKGFDGNGIIPFPTTASDIHQGLGLKAITDGTSKTVMLTETCELSYAAWIDGQANWVVGAWQGPSQVPSEKGAADGYLGWPNSDQASRIAEGLNPDQNPGEIYLSAARFGAGHDRRWGPSSEHREGEAVVHLFVDGHVTWTDPKIDRNVYLRIISRDGGEPVTLEY